MESRKQTVGTERLKGEGNSRIDDLPMLKIDMINPFEYSMMERVSPWISELIYAGNDEMKQKRDCTLRMQTAKGKTQCCKSWQTLLKILVQCLTDIRQFNGEFDILMISRLDFLKRHTNSTDSRLNMCITRKCSNGIYSYFLLVTIIKAIRKQSKDCSYLTLNPYCNKGNKSSAISSHSRNFVSFI